MVRRPLLVCLFAALLPQAASVTAEDVIPHHQDAPPGPALSPQEAIRRMTVPEGFSVELVASEPDLVNPVAMTFDERGRIWITESLEYPRKTPGPGRDRVKILEDTDGDGKADKFSIFAEGLNIPSGIAVGHGGVWVANSPDILFYPDKDRDGRPDGPPQTIVTGFGRTDTHELPNSLTWGPDGYLYGLNGVFNHSDVHYAKENPNYKSDHPGWQFTCAMFRIHPVTREFEIFCEGTSNPWGIAFDHEGSAFISACVIDHLWHLVRTGYYHRQGGPYPPFTWKIESIVKHKHQKAAYCGLEYYDSDAYPEQYRNKLYMGNIHGGCINVDKLERDGSTYFATGEPDFLTANDAWFMPVSQKTGPDGCLYILDWYDRYHCYQDANRDPPGIDRLKGRLYRVRYKDTPRAKQFDLAKENDEQLIARLVAKNGFIQDTARRVLVERRASRDWKGDDPIVVGTRKLIGDLKQPRTARVQAMWTALALHRAPDDLLSDLIRDKDPTFRAWAVRSVGEHGSGFSTEAQAAAKSADSEPDVRLQALIASNGKYPAVSQVVQLTEYLMWCGDDKLIPHIVWNQLHPLLVDKEMAATFVWRVQNVNLRAAPAVGAIIPRAVDRMLASKEIAATALASLFASLRDREPKVARQCLQLIAARVESGELRGSRINELRDAFSLSLQPLLDNPANRALADDAVVLAASWGEKQAASEARRMLSDSDVQPALRLRALTSLIASADEQALSAAAEALAGPASNKELQAQIISALGKLDRPNVATVMLKLYISLPAEVQPKAIELLTQRAIWARPLVAAIAAGKIPASVLNVNQVQKLLAFNDAELTAAVNKHWGTIRTSRDPARERFVGEMRKLIRTTKGDPHRGIEVFNRVCGQCHKIYGQGQDVGPEITLNGRASVEQLLSNVFDPSLVIGAAYQARTVLASDGRVITGLVVEDSPQRVVLKLQGGKLETIAREDVDAMKVSELSLMPEGLEKQLKPQEIADLFAFITLDKHPDDPTARPIPSGADGKRK
jgi:putative membrane-bound dehydrogenase-like protein